MALSSTQQADFSAGIFRQRVASPGGAYDLLNFLIDDEQHAYRRGGTSAWSTTSGLQNMFNAVSQYFAAPKAWRTIGWPHATAETYVVDESKTTHKITGTWQGDLGRPVQAGGLAIFPNADNDPTKIGYYAGSVKTAAYSTGTISTTAGKTVTGSGTSWLASIDPGGILFATVGTVPTVKLGVVSTVDSNTSLTLVDDAASVVTTAAYTVLPAWSKTFTDLPVLSPTAFVGAAGSGQPRLVLALGNRAFISPRGDPLGLTADTYLELPGGESIIGVAGMGDSALLFTTQGVWRADNLSFDPVDAYGNIQWTQERVSQDVRLWGDLGISAYEGRLIVPAIDDIYMFSVSGASESITQWTIRSLYHDYVKAGYAPGMATTFHGHYFLPILNGTTVIDVLVARLDRPHLLSSRPRIWIYPWTRWSGDAACPAYAYGLDASGAPRVLAVQGQRFLDITSCFDPSSSNAADNDGSVHQAQIITNDYPSGTQPAFTKQLRLTYELTNNGAGSTPTVAVEYSSDQDGGTFTTLTEKGLQGGGTGGATSDASKYSWWNVGKRRQRLRLRITQSGAAGTFVLRQLEKLDRPQGRQ